MVRPVIVTDVIPTWEAANWTRDFFRDNYGKERVTMKAVDVSRLYLVDDLMEKGETLYVECHSCASHLISAILNTRGLVHIILSPFRKKANLVATKEIGGERKYATGGNSCLFFFFST